MRRSIAQRFDKVPRVGPNGATVIKRPENLSVALMAACVMALCGCGGEYILTVPDLVAPPGETANVVIRLERYEFASLRMTVEGAPMRFQVGKLLEVGAYTDEMGFTGLLTDAGYAGTAVPMPETEGTYVLNVSLQDNEGDQAHVETPVYVWARGSALTAVDLDSLPVAEEMDAVYARAALAAVAMTSHVVYLTQAGVGDKAALREKIVTAGYPDGPVFTWRRSTLHFVRTGPLRLPQFVRESRLVMHMRYLKALYPGLAGGICTTSGAAAELAEAGIMPVLVGEADVEGLTVTRRSTWSDLARRGVAK